MPVNVIGKIRGQIGSLGILVSWSERRYARRASLDVLETYRREHAAHPELSGKELYTQVVAAHTGADRQTASRIVRQAGESFADWPNWRDMTFRDVVSFLVLADYMRSNPGRGGTSTNMRRVVARVIPGDL
jgi:hypothetical protein